METWVLIVVMWASKGSFASQEFTSEQRCREALTVTAKAWAEAYRASHERTMQLRCVRK